MKAPTAIKVREAAADWLEGAKNGIIRPLSGDPYKPSAIRAYEAALRLRALPAVGHMRLSEVTRVDLQDLVDELLAGGLSASAIGVTLLPLRAIYRRAMDRGEVAINPTTDLRMPKVHGGRDRVASPEEAQLDRGSPRSRIGHCGPRRCTRGCAVASSRRCAGAKSTSRAA